MTYVVELAILVEVPEARNKFEATNYGHIIKDRLLEEGLPLIAEVKDAYDVPDVEDYL